MPTEGDTGHSEDQTGAVPCRSLPRASLARASTLVGMVLAVAGTGLPWAAGPPPAGVSALGALFANARPHLVNAFALSVGQLRLGWLITALAVGCALTSAAPDNPAGERLGRLAHSVCSASVLMIVILHAAPRAGVAITLVGASLLAFGAYTRFPRET